ncbi:bifunctional homocysteine S-methyltransferase/methylenetetrahydrofolate reductase [Pelosinus sp. sgz500959]|uniref:bifunctional homocysteine S-methyltransferase/methylenetetrahydrofolate reductase n=1 Tax=Pelosinus sp. sgz500959 TaxID=3242472 RepID=UPI00366A76E1
MINIREYLQDNILITDGAMGTYYAQLTGNYDELPEYANVNNPKIIKQIHKEYMAAGAKLIKTNTFSANPLALDVSKAKLKELIIAGIDIAHEVTANKNIFVAASIGPIPEMADHIHIDQEKIMADYQFIVDVFLEQGIKIFIFETFSDVVNLGEISKYIKAKDPNLFILTQFATTPEGFTRKGISNEHIVAEVKKTKNIDAYGFNCGVGPTHLYNSLQKINMGEDIVAVAPNAGYPEIIHERTVYIQNPDYFAEKMKEIGELGVKILGGCCGTTPIHIEKMAELIHTGSDRYVPKEQIVTKEKVIFGVNQLDGFAEKVKQDQFVIAVELDPPFHADVELMLDNARVCKESGVDVITIADSPMGRARVDSIMIAAKIKREVGIEVIPHVCCRDKNLNALKSSLLAGYAENIRNILAVTGDPVAMADKNDIKSVFNLNSFKLIELIATMNQEVFAGQPIHIGGALNLNGLHPEVEVTRMGKKVDRGAKFFLTQPIFDENVIHLLPQLKQDGKAKILGGIMPLVSYRNAHFLNNEVAGIRIPEHILNQFDKNMAKEEAELLGIEIAVDLANKMKDHVHGFYFITPFNRVEMIRKIIKKLNL